MRKFLLGALLLVLALVPTSLAQASPQRDPAGAPDSTITCYPAILVHTIALACGLVNYADAAAVRVANDPTCVYYHGVPSCSPGGIYISYFDCYLHGHGVLDWVNDCS